MPITINGSGTVTGISAGGLPDGVITTDDIAANAVTLGKIGTTEQGQLCKAWVNFDGTGTVAIRTSFNVSSITDHAVGIYSINFANALADANYATTFAGGDGFFGSVVTLAHAVANTATSCRIRTATNSGTVADSDVGLICLAFFR